MGKGRRGWLQLWALKADPQAHGPGRDRDAGCHSAVTPLPIVFRGGKRGEQKGEKPPASSAPALPRRLYQKSRRW